MTRFACLALSLLGPLSMHAATGERIVDGLIIRDTDDCTAQSCNTFEEGPCSCLDVLEDDGKGELAMRAESILYTMAQSMRYITDYETTKGTLQNLWLPTKVKNARLMSTTFKDLEFIAGALGSVPKVSSLVNTPVKDLASLQFTVPAGAWPIMVEIWDQDVASGEFIGEVGVPLAFGHNSYTLPLRPDSARSAETAEMAERSATALGEVSFDTVVEYDLPAREPCSNDDEEECVTVSLTVTCKRATNLPNLDRGPAGLTDPYCKVRVKEDIEKASSKDKTPSLPETLNPVWTDGNVFSYSWEARLIKADDENGEDFPWTLDHMSLFEQFYGNANYLAKLQVLDGEECDMIESKTTAQTKICDALQQFGGLQVKESIGEEIKGHLSASDAEHLARMERLGGAPSALLETSVRSRRAAAMARRRRSGPDYRRRYQSPEEKKREKIHSAVFWVVFIVAMILIGIFAR